MDATSCPPCTVVGIAASWWMDAALPSVPPCFLPVLDGGSLRSMGPSAVFLPAASAARMTRPAHCPRHSHCSNAIPTTSDPGSIREPPQLDFHDPLSVGPMHTTTPSLQSFCQWN